MEIDLYNDYFIIIPAPQIATYAVLISALNASSVSGCFKTSSLGLVKLPTFFQKVKHRLFHADAHKRFMVKHLGLSLERLHCICIV